MACGGCGKRRKEFLERQGLKNQIIQTKTGIALSQQPAISTANHLTPQQINNMAPVILMNQYKKPTPTTPINPINNPSNLQNLTPKQIRIQNRKRRVEIRNERIKRRIAKAEKIKQIKEKEALQSSRNIEVPPKENQ